MTRQVNTLVSGPPVTNTHVKMAERRLAFLGRTRARPAWPALKGQQRRLRCACVILYAESARAASLQRVAAQLSAQGVAHRHSKAARGEDN
jgi:hypothetical protein